MGMAFISLLNHGKGSFKELSKNFQVYSNSHPSPMMRINIKSFDQNELRQTCADIVTIASETGAVLSGPVPLPTQRRIYCVLRSPHVNKDSREHFEMRVHSRLFEINRWTPDTVDRLMTLEVPSAVNINVKL